MSNDNDMQALIQHRFDNLEPASYGFEEYAHILDQLEQDQNNNNNHHLVPDVAPDIDIHATRPEYQAQDEVNYLKQVATLVNLYVNQTKGVKINNIFDAETQTFVTRPPHFN